MAVRIGQASLGEFLLTPLREGRLLLFLYWILIIYFYSRPCGRGDDGAPFGVLFSTDFYSRPCGRGDCVHVNNWREDNSDFYSRPCGRGDKRCL